MATLIVISAPSGSGKTTITHEILRRHPEMTFSISATTRRRREGETDGKDYYFLTKAEFERKLSEDAFIEHEQIYTDYYGTLKSEVKRAEREGKALMFDVDVKGALSIKKQYPNDAVLIFIKPPNMETVAERLKGRKTESAETMERRLDRVPMELSKESEFDVVVVNDKLETAIEEVDTIVTKRLKR
ncbi:MAG TPA: guanylate kinase [Bacteroidota bacterium]|nr:guanylate kinase [Bacteroidota bacterium]